MLSFARVVTFCALFVSTTAGLLAQNVGTGLYQHGTFDNKGFDTINIGNLNTHFEIPIVQKSGRGLPFNYSIVYDGLIWSTTSSNGTSQYTPDSGWGFHGQVNGGAVVGLLTYRNILENCGSTGGARNPTAIARTGFVYHDPFGRSHALNYTSGYACGSNYTPATGDGSTTDGSGYTYDGTLIHSRDGRVISPNMSTSTGGGSVTDANGNIITNNSNGTYVDTTGTTVLTISGGATPSSPVQLTYPVTEQANSSTQASAWIYYATYTVQTNFGCPVGDYSATSVNLVDHITLANGDTYSFAYEPTPNGSGGTVSGRLASIALPTGGTISYSYYGGQNSIVCADGTPPGMSRTTSDGTKTYNRAGGNNGTFTETVTDELGKQTYYVFQVDSAGYYEATHRRAHDGAFSDTNLLEEDFYCFNGSPANCDGQAITRPITEADTTTTYNYVSSPATVKNTFNSTGYFLTQSQVYSGSTLMQRIVNSYAAPGTVTELLSSTAYDGQGNTISYTGYGYDETTVTTTSNLPQHTSPSGNPGNLTSTHVSVDGSTTNTLNYTTAYYDTGMPSYTTAPGSSATATNNPTTFYGYDATGTFLQSTTLPTPSSGVGLSTSASYDPASGALLSSTGMNGDTVTVSQYDSMLRPTQMTLASGSTVSTVYDTPNHWKSTQTLNNSGSFTQYEQLADAYGRISRVGRYNGQSGADWYQEDYCYDGAGLLNFVPTPYQGSGENVPIRCSGNGTSYQHDGLGRITQVASSDGDTVTTTYNGRAVKVADNNGPTRISQYDLLGNLARVCEVTSNAQFNSGGTEDCGMDIGGSGYRTNYTYDLAGHHLNINAGTQTRDFYTDAAGRATQTLEPERGSTTYTYAYNSTGLAITRSRPRANQGDRNTVTHSTTQLDALSRTVNVHYDDGITPDKIFLYDTHSNWAEQDQQLNLKGRLSISYRSYPGIGGTGVIFSYDPTGNIVANFECTPASCGNANLDRMVNYSYDLAGNLTGEGDGAGDYFSYGRSAAGEVTGITNLYPQGSDPATIATAVQNSPLGPSSYTLGNGLNQQFGYDTMGRLNSGALCIYSTSPGCNGGSQVYGFSANWQGSRMNSSTDTVNQNYSYGYDDLNRLSSMAGPTSLNWVYDRWGNRYQQNLTAGSAPTVNYANIPKETNQISGFSYDAAGNLINDGNHTYTYDADGNLVQVDGGGSGYYTYDGLNRRTRIQRGGIGWDFIYDQNNRRVSSWSSSDYTLANALVYWDGRPVAFRSAGSMHFQHQDWLGTERLRTGAGGAQETTFKSLPFGDNYTLGGDQSDKEWYHFAGLDNDYEANSQHAQFRQYSTTQGRWISPDPYDGSYDTSNPQSLNRYSYAGNNPLVFVDPDGLDYTDSAGNPCYTNTYTNSNGVLTTSVSCYTYGPPSPRGTPIPWYISEYGGPTCGWNGGGYPFCPGTTAYINQHGTSVTSKSLPAPSKPNRPPLPNHPDWASPSTDIKSLQGGWNNIDAIQILNFKRMVQTGGPMDYKQWGDYVDFGNFNFGYVGAGLGIPDEMLRWGAGYANWHDNPQNRPIYESPFNPNNHTHGDQPGDQAQINAGIAAYKAGCHY